MVPEGVDASMHVALDPGDSCCCEPERSTSTSSGREASTTGITTVAAILHSPWDVINASFEAPLLLPKDKARIHSVARLHSRQYTDSSRGGKCPYSSLRDIDTCRGARDSVPHGTKGPSGTNGAYSAPSEMAPVHEGPVHVEDESSDPSPLESPVRTTSVPHTLRVQSMGSLPLERDAHDHDHDSAPEEGVCPASYHHLPVRQVSIDMYEHVLPCGEGTSDSESDSAFYAGIPNYSGSLDSVDGEDSSSLSSLQPPETGPTLHPLTVCDSAGSGISGSGMKCVCVSEPEASESSGCGGILAPTPTVGHLSVSERVARVDRTLVEALERLSSCIPEDSPLYRLADGLRGVTSALEAKPRHVRGPSLPQREGGPESPTVQRPAAAAPSPDRMSKTDTLMLLLKAIPQISRLCFTADYARNPLLSIFSMHKTESQKGVGLFFLCLQAFMCSFFAYDISNRVDFARYPFLESVRWNFIGLKHSARLVAVVSVLRIGTHLLTYGAGIHSCCASILRSVVPSLRSYLNGRVVNGCCQLVVVLGLAGVVYTAAYILAHVELDPSTEVIHTMLDALMSVCPFLITLEAYITLFALPATVALPVLLFSVCYYLPASAVLYTVSIESSLLFGACNLVVLFASLQAITQVVSFFLNIRFIVETVAAKVLVSRVASGAYFNRLLDPMMSGIVERVLPPLTTRMTSQIKARIRTCPEAKVAIDRTCLIAMVWSHFEGVERGNSPVVSEDMAPLCRAQMHAYITSMYAALYGRQMAPSGDTPCITPCITPLGSPCTSPSGSPPHSTPPGVSLAGADDVVVLFPDAAAEEEDRVLTHLASPSEHRIMQQNGIEFLPLCVYSKLDIVGFTHYCSVNGADVVSLLNMLFMAFDGIVDKYQGSGVTKIKTVGDAYELMRPFRVSELHHSTVQDVACAVSAMTQATHEMLQCALDVFETVEADLSVRCGLAIGPGFAGVLGRTRVCYEVFGLAPTHARTLEGVSPVGHVTVCKHSHALLKSNQRYIWGDRVVSAVPPSSPPLHTSHEALPPTEASLEFEAIHDEYIGLLTDCHSQRGEETEVDGIETPPATPSLILGHSPSPKSHVHHLAEASLDSVPVTPTSYLPVPSPKVMDEVGTVGDCLHVRVVDTTHSKVNGVVLVSVIHS
ncbi:hypothetical protein KIPB_004438 [Kipferlia bialata]|uniref:Guanylate cyclase domain-containing protein n=1 Tax=Kipferlia bialata TaxID=797122 RepID=A0A9K3CTT3_9EUKA|nr:hypothetical protein KIPB_004438 [Kipferlia bialata]|eukprot:g4438.t1